jgi:hypothetical protein
MLLGDFADTQRELRIKGVGQVANDQADGPRPATYPQVARRIVPQIAELADSGANFGLGVLGDPWVVVEHPRYGHNADPAKLRHITHGGHSSTRCGS